MEIKGIKEGILITLENQDWEQARNALIRKITEKQPFFQGACLVLDVGSNVLQYKELSDMREHLKNQGVMLSGVLSKSLVTQKTARGMGLITKLEKPSIKPEKLSPLDTVLTGESAIFIQRTIRSGFKVVHKGHVIILGDVNPGAEIVASGSVIIWGHMRGTVHAGADGDESANVCALDLSPTQLRIASIIATTPKDHALPKPEIASIVEGQIIAQTWKNIQGDL